MEYSEFSSQVTTQLSVFNKDLSTLQAIVQSLSVIQGELSLKVDSLLAQEKPNTDRFNAQPGARAPATDEHLPNKKRSETELWQTVSSLKKDVEKKINMDKKFKAEVLENKIEADIRMDRTDSQISEMTNDLSSLRRQLKEDEQSRETKERVYRLENTTKDISKRREEESVSLKLLSEQAARDKTDLDQLRGRMDSLEQLMKLNNKRIEDVKQQCCEVCQLFAIKLVPLEKLREGLCQNVKETDINKSWLVELDKDVTKLKKFESAAKVIPVGFTAYFKEAVKLLTKNSILNGFTDVRVNAQNCFDPASGCFTAPFDGMYAASVTLCQMSSGYVEAFLHHKKHGSPDTALVARVVGHREMNGSSDTGMAVVFMKHLDKLFIKKFLAGFVAAETAEGKQTHFPSSDQAEN